MMKRLLTLIAIACVLEAACAGHAPTAPETPHASPSGLAVKLTMSGTPSVGAVLQFTATASGVQPMPASLLFSWRYDRTQEAITTASPATVKQIFNTAGPHLVEVTATTPDGKSAFDTLSLTIQ